LRSNSISLLLKRSRSIIIIKLLEVVGGEISGLKVGSKEAGGKEVGSKEVSGFPADFVIVLL